MVEYWIDIVKQGIGKEEKFASVEVVVDANAIIQLLKDPTESNS